jgi:hypothetical protein
MEYVSYFLKKNGTIHNGNNVTNWGYPEGLDINESKKPGHMTIFLVLAVEHITSLSSRNPWF